MSSPFADRFARIAYDHRVRELSAWTKTRLAARWYEVNPHTIWTFAPPERWSRDELVNDILRSEFPS